jgi:tripartite-type tricarboxylate transporter receptor subunit TctC
MYALTRRAFMAASALAPLTAFAQSWPPGITRIIVPYPPGGSVDPIARLIQPGLQKRLATTVIVENRTGASGSIGTDMVAKSPPDGRTWLFTFDNFVLNPFVLPALPFDTVNDLDPVYLLGKAPYVMCTQAQKSYRSLADVLAAARARPGQINYGTPGPGSLGHLATLLLAKRGGADLVHVPYRGGGPALNDAVAGHIELFVGSVAVALPQIQSGALRPIVQMGQNRIDALPQTPTAIESGFAGFIADAWWGFFAAAKTPPALITRFVEELKIVLGDENVSKQITETLQVSLVHGGPEELRRFVAEEMKTWGPVATEHGIKAG